jgi:hypothetical protein
MATQEQLKQIYAELKGQFDQTLMDLQAKVVAMEANRFAGGSGHGGKSFNYKSFTRMDKFTGDGNEWSGWLFNLKVLRECDARGIWRSGARGYASQDGQGKCSVDDDRGARWYRH